MEALLRGLVRAAISQLLPTGLSVRPRGLFFPRVEHEVVTLLAGRKIFVK